MMDWPTIPDGVVESIERRWPERSKLWAERVEAELRELCGRYDAEPRDVLPSRYGFVVVADSPHGGIVLRSSPDPDARIQAEVAYALAELDVAPQVHATVTSGAGLWTIMDEVLPGTPLALAERTAVDLDALAAPFAAMRNRPAPVPDMLTIFDWLKDRLEDDQLADVPVWREGPAPLGERVEALRILADLALDARPALCHGDASTWNLLYGRAADWKLIDPRGVSGEVEYDVAVVATKLRGVQVAAEVGRYLAGAVDVSFDRVAAWMAVVEAARV